MNIREMSFAVRNPPADLYAQHQLVWSLVAPYLHKDGEFLFDWQPAAHHARILVRGRLLVGTDVWLPSEGVITARVVAEKRCVNNGIQVRTGSETCAWLRTSLAEHGIEVINPRCFDPETLIGIKRQHNIRLIARRVEAGFRIIEASKAWNLYANGLGRAKRFGCGMLRVVAANN